MRSDERGTILIATLWILAILAILASGIGFRSSFEARLSKYNMDKLKASYIAKAGIFKSREILFRDNNACDTIRECGVTLPPAAGSRDDKGDNKDSLKEIFTANVGDGAFEVSYSEDGKNYYGMIDEERKININRASPMTLERLLGPKSKDIAASIVNWRGTIQVPNSNGAWDNYYKSLSPPYECKHADFSVIEELMLVKDMTPELFESIKDYITVYGDEDRVNINTATKRVMVAFGLSDSLADLIIKIRNGEDKIAGTNDDQVFYNVTTETQNWNITLEERVVLGNNFTSRSNYFRIVSRGTIKGSKIDSKIECVIDRGAKKLKYYREY